jgi:hypothetical protein
MPVRGEPHNRPVPIGSLLSGARGGLLIRQLLMRAMNRPRLTVAANVAQVWMTAAGTPATPLALMVTVSNPSPHPLLISHIGVVLDKRGVAFPPSLRTIVGSVPQFQSKTASMTMADLDQFLSQYGAELPAGGAIRIVVTDGLGKEWYSKKLNRSA